MSSQFDIGPQGPEKTPDSPSAPNTPPNVAFVSPQMLTSHYEEERRYIFSSAQCLLWYADIFETGDAKLNWRMRFPDEAAAQRFLPIAVHPEDEGYAGSWFLARLPEDQIRSDQYGNAAIQRGESYQQEFRCRRLDGQVCWLREEVQVEVVVSGQQWRAVGVCTDITQHKQIQLEHQRDVERQRRLMESAAAINASQTRDDILRLVRDAIVEAGGFDRAGTLQIENGVVQGAWGTDTRGQRIAEHDFVEPLAAWTDWIKPPLPGEPNFLIVETDNEADPDSGLIPCAVVSLRADGQLLGLLCMDNLLSGRPVLPEAVLPLMPFCEQAASAIANIRLQEERKRHIECQRRLASLAAAICASTTLHEILRMVRDAILEAGKFDRVGVFLLDTQRNLLQGAWGVDRAGQGEDISYQVYPITAEDRMPMPRVARGELDYYLTADLTCEFTLASDEEMYGVHAHAIVPLQVEGLVVGTVTVDNLLTDAPISQEDIHSLLPFAAQAAVAIQNARLFDELHRTQEALVRSAQLRAVGELASGVAHNVNNVLMAVIGYADLITMMDETPPEIKQYVHTIKRAALDGAEIVSRIQRFARLKTVAAPEVLNLREVIQDALDLTRPLWQDQATGRGFRIDVKGDLASELWMVGVASELREVMVSLFTNAIDAMPQGGCLRVHAFSANNQGIVEVQDTGVGMDEMTRQRVFEPFFTTKGVSRGTGLGLSVAWGIISQHKGYTEVESATGKGTTFRLHFPLVKKPLPLAQADEKPIGLRGKRILLVDDEEAVRDSLYRLLTAQEAHVIPMNHAALALEWLTLHADGCDLILSDHGMPGQTGSELLTTVRNQYPYIRRVLLSGWGRNLPGNVEASAAELILTKPIQPQNLGNELAALLSQVPSTG